MTDGVMPQGGLPVRARFYALSDDQSEFAPARFYTLKITLNSSETAKIGIQKVEVESVTFLTNKDGQTYPKGTIAPKGIALTPQQTVFISGSSVAHNRIAPFIQEFDINTGQMRDSLPIPERYLPNVADEPERTRGVTQTGAFASLTFNPTGTIPASGEPIRLFTATESALVQDQDLPGSEQGTKCRFLHYLIGYGGPVLISEYFYPLLTPDGAISNDLEELIAVDQGGHFLSLERSTDQLGFSEKIFQMATGGATDTSRIASLKGSLNGIRPIQKKLLLDLNELGIPLDNLQGMTLGPRLSDGTQSLVLVSDDNFDDKQVTKLLLFRLSKPKTITTR